VVDQRELAVDLGGVLSAEPDFFLLRDAAPGGDDNGAGDEGRDGEAARAAEEREHTIPDYVRGTPTGGVRVARHVPVARGSEPCGDEADPGAPPPEGQRRGTALPGRGDPRGRGARRFRSPG